MPLEQRGYLRAPSHGRLNLLFVKVVAKVKSMSVVLHKVIPATTLQKVVPLPMLFGNYPLPKMETSVDG